jgi:hypothetical protein
MLDIAREVVGDQVEELKLLTLPNDPATPFGHGRGGPVAPAAEEGGTSWSP